MPRKIDMTGKRFGRLTVVCEAGLKRKEIAWKCICDCGKTVIVPGYPLRSGKTKSCGCYMRDQTKNANRKHGMFGTPIYRTYFNMKNRCYNPHYYLYKDYGGRGISVCNEWLGDDGFSNFYKWAKENGYHQGLSLDRIDCDGNYSPQNCRWVNMIVQQNNRRNNHMITANGQTHTMAEWARISKIPYSTIQRRIHSGWKDSEAVTRELQRHASSKC